MKMSRQGPGARWKSNSWSSSTVAMVDTHSAARCAAPQAEGIKSPAPPLGRGRSPQLQQRVFISIFAAPRVGGRKYRSKTQQRGGGAADG